MIYLDNNATTRPSEAVVGAMHDALTDFWHNPSSVHRAGQRARQQVELARQDVAELIGAKPRDVVFTSGGTEAIDLAIRGVLGAIPKASTRRALVTTGTEHSAVRDLADELEKSGCQVRRVGVTREGLVDLASLQAAIPGAALVSIQWANNETGAIQPVLQINRLCRAAGAVFHCDGTQFVGKLPVHALPPFDEGVPADPLPCDLLTFSPHKFHGPKGVGVVWSRPGIKLRPTLLGTQEMGRRAGTENVPGIVGAGVASREAAAWLADPLPRRRLADERDRFEQRILSQVEGAAVNGPRDQIRLWNTTNIAFPRLEAEALLLLLSERGVCASAGAACSSGSLDPSPVLLAMGIPPDFAHGSVRFSLSRESTAAELDEAAGVVVECVRRLSQSTLA